MITRISKKIAYLLIIVAIGGLGGILADRYLFPYLAATKMFSKYEFLKKSTEDVTVINKTEQVFIKEDTFIEKISNQISASVVNIVSAGDQTKNGTGVVVTSDGLIMTYAAALVPQATSYKIIISDGSAYDAEFWGIDSYSNLAFLKINGANLPAISFANSDDTNPGEKIVAVGNSLENYSNRYASGLLSSFDPTFNLAGKAISFSDKLEGVFQTDLNAEANLIGGPVVDYAGQTIGVIGTLEKNGSADYFVIPSNKAKHVIDRAIARELPKNPALGVYFVPITKTFALTHNLDQEKGALIYSPSGQAGLAMISGSIAQKSGLRINDIIVAINGQEITLKNTLPDLLYQNTQGNEIELTVWREKQEIKIPVKL